MTLRSNGASLRGALLLLLAGVVVLAVRAILAFSSYHRVRRATPSGRTRLAPPTMCVRVARAVARVSRFVPGATCLTQAFAVQIILAVRGFASEIRIGVAQQDDGGFSAHAWLMSGGQVVTGGQAETIARYQQVATLPTPGR